MFEHHEKKYALFFEEFSGQLKGCVILDKMFRKSASNVDNFLPDLDGFQLEFVSISRVINQMTCYKFKCSHWWKIYFKKKFSLQSEYCNFDQ